MSWKFEIFRAFFTAFGSFEIITNIGYLIRKNGLVLAVKQHQELPPNLKTAQIKIKVLIMFIFGVLFLSTGLHSYLTHSFESLETQIVLILFAIYAVLEGCYYRYWRTIGFSCVSVLVLLIFLFL